MKGWLLTEVDHDTLLEAPRQVGVANYIGAVLPGSISNLFRALAQAREHRGGALGERASASVPRGAHAHHGAAGQAATSGTTGPREGQVSAKQSASVSIGASVVSL